MKQGWKEKAALMGIESLYAVVEKGKNTAYNNPELLAGKEELQKRCLLCLFVFSQALRCPKCIKLCYENAILEMFFSTLAVLQLTSLDQEC